MYWSYLHTDLGTPGGPPARGVWWGQEKVTRLLNVNVVPTQLGPKLQKPSTPKSTDFVRVWLLETKSRKKWAFRGRGFKSLGRKLLKYVTHTNPQNPHPLRWESCFHTSLSLCPLQHTQRNNVTQTHTHCVWWVQTHTVFIPSRLPAPGSHGKYCKRVREPDSEIFTPSLCLHPIKSNITWCN